MREFNAFAIDKSSQQDMFLLIPHPFVFDITEIVEEFNEFNNDIKQGQVLMDLQTIVGNRKEKFVILDIENFDLVRETLRIYYKSTEELNEFKRYYYSGLDERITKHLSFFNKQLHSYV